MVFVALFGCLCALLFVSAADFEREFAQITVSESGLFRRADVWLQVRLADSMQVGTLTILMDRARASNAHS
jgi:hypothetical protein